MPKVGAIVDVSAEECMRALEDALLPPGGFPDASLVRRLVALHDKVMYGWIPPEERCPECGGHRECAGGSHSRTCHGCGGSGRRAAPGATRP